VQWLRPISDGQFGRQLAVDQQGNAFVFCTGPYVAAQGYQLQLWSYNPSGAVRAGFPVTVGYGVAVAAPGGLAIDAIGQAHVIGLTAVLNQWIYTASYGVFGNSGDVVRAPAGINLGLPGGLTYMQQTDLALDYAGKVYVASTYQTNTGGGMVVQALRTSDLAVATGYPVNLASQFSVGFARPVNSVNNAALVAVPLPALSGTGSVLNAFDVLSGGQSSGFPVALGDVSAYFGAVDVTGTTWLAGEQTVDTHHRVWLAAYSAGGAAHGTAKVVGVATDTEDNALGAGADPAGTFYVAGHSHAGSGDYTFWIARVPAL
jgi:hypothetical protein